MIPYIMKYSYALDLTGCIIVSSYFDLRLVIIKCYSNLGFFGNKKSGLITNKSKLENPKIIINTIEL